MCGMARLVWPALLAALAVPTMTGSDAYGWLAAGATAGAIALWDRARGTTTSCALPPTAATTDRPVHDHEADAPEPTLAPPPRADEPTAVP